MASNTSTPSSNTSQPHPNQQPYPHQALQNLIKKFTSFKSPFESDHHKSSVVSLGDHADSKNGIPTDNLILDGFLKNNGGYLDDSDTSDSEDSDNRPPNETNQNIHTIHVLAKKYQNEDDSDEPAYSSLIGLKLPKKIFKLNFNYSDDRHQHISTIVNNQNDYQNLPEPHRARDFLSTTKHENNHAKYHSKYSTQPLNHWQPRSVTPDDVETNHPIQFIRHKTQQNQIQTHQKGVNKFNPSSSCQRKNYHYDRIHNRQSKDEDWDLNSKYIQSSTFPTKNTIIEPDHHQDNPYRTSKNHSRIDRHQPAMVTANNHHIHPKKSKSPFRNLVLGQDDLLRSN